MTKRSINIDLIKVFAMLGVVFLHNCSGFAYRADFIDSTFWWLVAPLSILATFAVPLFFMVSGYLAGTKEISIKDNVRKTLLYLGVPFAFFFVVRLVEIYLLHHQRSSFPAIISNESLHIMDSFLWYLVYLIALRLLTPLFNLIFSFKNHRLPQYLLLVITIFMLLNSFNELENAAHSSVYDFLNVVYLYLFGCMVKQQLLPKIVNWKLIIFSVIGVTLMTLAFYYQLKFGSNKVLHVTSNWLSYIIIPSIFLILLKIPVAKILRKIISWLALMSFGVYLWQESVAILRRDVLGFEYDFAGLSAYLYCPLSFAFVFFGSLLLTFLTSLIPKVRAVVGFK